MRSQKAAVACHRPGDVLVMWLLKDGFEEVVSGEGWRLWVAVRRDPCGALMSPGVLRTHSLSYIPAHPLMTSDVHQFLPCSPLDVDLYCIWKVSQQPRGHSWASVLGPVANACAVLNVLTYRTQLESRRWTDITTSVTHFLVLGVGGGEASLGRRRDPNTRRGNTVREGRRVSELYGPDDDTRGWD